MAEFLTTTGISFHIENIIKNAQRNLFLISPYLKLTQNFYERLKDAAERGVKIEIYYGKNELTSDEKQKLSLLSNIQLYFSENLHAKCYFNETTMVVTSMNMYEFSEKNNREMGILLTAINDPKIFQDVIEESQSIKSSAKKDFNRKWVFTNKNNFQSNKSGFCIRCSQPIKFSTTKPLCTDCYKEWNIWSNGEYPERYCHKCGQSYLGTFNRPLCQQCFDETHF